MASQPLESRVDNLENRVTQLEEQLGPTDPSQPQVLPLRAELRAELSAVRSEIAEQGKALRAEISKQGMSLGAKIDAQGTHMRVLHEEVLARKRNR
ncbi:MAG: hypothetical protein WD690_10055 [Vicinamibacterales bacterium]